MKASRVLPVAELVAVLAASSKAQRCVTFPPPPVSVLEVQPQDVPSEPLSINPALLRSAVAGKSLNYRHRGYR